MQIVSNGDNLHVMSNPVFWENKKNISMSPAVFFFLPRVLTVKVLVTIEADDILKYIYIYTWRIIYFSEKINAEWLTWNDKPYLSYFSKNEKKINK